MSTRSLIRAVLAATAAIVALAAALRGAPLLAARLGEVGSLDEARPVVGSRAAVIVSATPHVERSAAGAWVEAREGDALAPSEGLRTGAGSTAEVALAGGTRLTVDEGSEIDVREIGPSSQRIRLVRGRVAVDQRANVGGTMHVEGSDGPVASAGRGRWTAVTSAGGGRWAAVASADALAVAVVDGVVRLDSGAGAVDVPAGSEAAAWRGAPPLPPRPVPSGVILRLARAVSERHRTVCAVLHVDVASEVRVNGETAPVAPDGRVLVRVPPADRRRHADVVVRHASGSVQRRAVRCDENEADVSEVEVRWDDR